MLRSPSAEELAAAVVREYEQQLTDRETSLIRREAELEERVRRFLDEGTPRRLDVTGEATPAPQRPTNNPPRQDVDLTVETEALRAEVERLRQELQRGRIPAVEHSRPVVTPYVKLKEIVDTIPQFNGYNMSVLQFTRACKRALEMLPTPVSSETEGHFVRMTRTKLQGHAYLVVEDEVVLTVERLKDILKTAFMPSRTASYYRGALANLNKKPDEHVLDYISRTKDLKQAIMDEELRQRRDHFGDYEKGSIENETLDCFINGLPPEYRLPLKMENYSDLTEAFAALVRVNQQAERDNERGRAQNRVKTPATNVTLVQRKPCSFCGKTNHNPDRCWHNQSRWPRHNEEAIPPREVRNQAPGTPLDRTSIICHYCKKSGHMKFDCEAKRQNDARRQPDQGNGTAGPAIKDASRIEKSKERPSTSATVIELA